MERKVNYTSFLRKTCGGNRLGTRWYLNGMRKIIYTLDGGY